MNIEEKIILCIKETTKREVEADTNLESLGLDSLDKVEICYAVEEDFGIVIPDEAIEQWQTVQDLINTTTTAIGIHGNG